MRAEAEESDVLERGAMMRVLPAAACRALRSVVEVSGERIVAMTVVFARRRRVRVRPKPIPAQLARDLWRNRGNRGETSICSCD